MLVCRYWKKIPVYIIKRKDVIYMKKMRISNVWQHIGNTYTDR